MSLRRFVRALVVSLVTGSLLITVAWRAPSSFRPPDVPEGELVVPDRADELGTQAGAKASNGEADTAAPVAAADAARVGQGEVLAGAAKVSINPAPDTAAGEEWQTQGCATGVTPGEAANTEKVWTESPNCLYMGGRGLGPSEPIKRIDPDNGLFVRTLALGDGKDTPRRR